ncbi:MAG: histidine triad nucleotide-binding protein [Clostridiales Family XIII bacterium]|jgi:histidine triad (HIT) family protein|nr:histidine triad nucleotide-binding protein [Clostridiales Family XIII bacterium]
MEDCIFCRICGKEVPTDVVYEDEHIFCFHDVSPQAPVHVLVIPKKHIVSLDDVLPEDQAVLGHLLGKIGALAKELGLENGYRLVSNCGEDAMQSVRHLHFHLLGKRKLAWPPG